VTTRTPLLSRRDAAKPAADLGVTGNAGELRQIGTTGNLRMASMQLLPTFRSPRYIAATPVRRLRKVIGTSKSMILVPLSI
jgi:hypothetical protein